MFQNIRSSVLARMKRLEQIDAEDRLDGTPRPQRLRQIPPDTGRFLALMLANAPEGQILEIGTSAGYSTLWLSLACEMMGRRLTTFELLPDKAKIARETFQIAEVENVVELVEGDALSYLGKYARIAFCFLDAEKEVYDACYEKTIPRLVTGGLLIADNAINFQEILEPMLTRAMSDIRVDSLIVPIGKGELVCRKI